VGGALLALPSLADGGGLEILPPEPVRGDGPILLRWRETRANELEDCPSAITWYYSPTADGTGKKRIPTRFWDNFSRGFRDNWRPEGQFIFNWIIDQDPVTKEFLLRCVDRPFRSALVLVEPVEEASVVSIRVRPRGPRGQFRVYFRLQDQGPANLNPVLPGLAYAVRQSGSKVQLQVSDSKEALGDCDLQNLPPDKWYWYEIGVRTKKKREVEFRVRVYDESHQTVIGSFDRTDRPERVGLLRSGFLALQGNADFGEVYIDPWSTRWMGDRANVLQWNTAGVPAGKYYVIAEISDGKAPARQVVSDFQVEVSGTRQAANE
jgi:hypothetical protein